MPKTIIITGATSGFGEACAHLFAQNGWQLVLTGRREDKLQRLRRELGKTTVVHTISMDVRSREAVEKGFASLPEAFNQIDVLVNNAGLALGLEPAHKASLEDWDIMVDTNIKGLLYCTRTLLPSMVARKTGTIINIGSVAGNWPYPGGNTYGASKAFVKQFTNNLRADLLGTGVRATNIEPGIAETEFSIVRFKGNTEAAGKVYDGLQPLTAADIANIIYWIATLPAHVNINCLEVMPTQQSFGPFLFDRSGT